MTFFPPSTKTLFSHLTAVTQGSCLAQYSASPAKASREQGKAAELHWAALAFSIK